MNSSFRAVTKPLKDVVFDLWYMCPQFLTEDELKLIEESVKSQSFEQSSTVGENGTDYRDSRHKWVSFDETWLYDKIWHWANVANDELWHFDLEGFIDNAQYTCYDMPNGHYDWHLDILGKDINHRKISMICLLGDEFVGGNVEFKTGKMNNLIEIPKGGAVFFPSFYLHRVMHITSGQRKSLVQWVSGNPYS